jgi:hypothetical protein
MVLLKQLKPVIQYSKDGVFLKRILFYETR